MGLFGNIKSQKFGFTYSSNFSSVHTFYFLQKQKMYLHLDSNEINCNKNYTISCSKNCTATILNLNSNLYEFFIDNVTSEKTKIYLNCEGKTIDSIEFLNIYYPFDFYINNPYEEDNALFEIKGLWCRNLPWGESFQVKSFEVAVYDSTMNLKIKKSFKGHHVDTKSAKKIKGVFGKYDYLIFENIMIEATDSTIYLINKCTHFIPGIFCNDSQKNIWHRFIKKNVLFQKSYSVLKQEM